ncbi:MAG: polymer-forming cytoskeletal protein [Candidatus Aminicenantes bacterium]|nr:MAG: polymer-forming cytoskeletal protein [Candidatus Aminicenantes bacterium]
MLEFNPETKDKNEKKILREHPPQNTARLGPSLLLKGELSGNEDLIIDGQFQGKIELKNHTLIIGREGKVEADIQAKNITINGNMKGNIFASGKVYISEEAQMDGNISASVISIMDGAQFKGSVKMEKGGQIIARPEEKSQGILALEEKETKDNTTSE